MLEFKRIHDNGVIDKEIPMDPNAKKTALRMIRPAIHRPFRMWLYPIPAVLAFLGYVYTVIMRPKSIESIRLAVAVLVVGSILFWIRSLREPRSAA